MDEKTQTQKPQSNNSVGNNPNSGYSGNKRMNFGSGERYPRPNRSENSTGFGGNRRRNRDEGANNRFGQKRNFGRRNQKSNRNKLGEEGDNFQTKVILVRRVTRVVKGGKRMRFSALVVVGDGNGKIGFGLKKGADYQDSVSKATRQAKNKLIKICLNDQELNTNLV
jgi:Ribosomal protein S5, N-terminal domain